MKCDGWSVVDERWWTKGGGQRVIREGCWVMEDDNVWMVNDYSESIYHNSSLPWPPHYQLHDLSANKLLSCHHDITPILLKQNLRPHITVQTDLTWRLMHIQALICVNIEKKHD